MKDNDLMSVLSTGKENAKTAKQIMNLLGYKNIRAVTREIFQLRINGEIICSSTDSEFAGYYLPDKISEVVEYKHQILSRIDEMKRALSPAEEYLQALGQ